MRKWHVMGSKEVSRVFEYAARYARKVVEPPAAVANDMVAANLVVPKRGEYCIGKLLASGGLCDIYRAEDKETGAPLAIKVIENCHNAIEVVRNEVLIHKKLVHPLIVPLLDSFDDSINTYLVMPLFAGGSVYDRIAKTGKPCEGTLEIALQVAKAIEFCHASNVIWRDCKVENVLFVSALAEEVKQDNSVRICDLGCSVAFDTGKEPRDVLKYSDGTLMYYSPEQWRESPYDEKIDVWGLGFLLFDMLTMGPLFSTVGKRWSNVYLKFRVGEFAAMDEELTNHKALVKRLMAFDPKERPSASEAIRLIQGELPQ